MAKPVAPKPAATFTAHYISGTHWDREWYRPLQEYRYLLVGLIDELLELLDRNPDFRYFQLDGQTCVLSDYVEIRPENRERLAHYISAGRILVGPWYTMPDLFGPGDEALIRNLLLGQRICRAWDVKPMPVGYTCDMFGHPSQMPQIFAGFGISDVVAGRGTNEHTTPTFFTWESPDGSQAFTFKLQDSQGYGAFAAPRAMLEKYEMISGGNKELNADLAAAGDDPVKRTAVQEKWFKIELAKYVGHEMKRANGSTFCVMDSMDHILPATDVARYIRLMSEAFPEVKTVHSTLPAFFAEARRNATTVPVRRGELREPSKNRCGYLFLIPHCVSARVRMKQANDGAQNLLEKWAEPFLAIANLQGAAIPERFLEVCWEHVLTNHAHDSICGCSIDQVHRDMMYRFDQARVLGEQLRHQSIASLTRQCADLATGPDEFTLTVVNPLPFKRDEVVVFDVDLPTDYPAQFQEGFNTQHLKAFTFEDAAGKPVPYQRLEFKPQAGERSHVAKYCFINDGPLTRYTVAAKLALPALGFTSLRVKPSPLAVRAVGSLRTGPTAAENANLAIAIESNGTLTLTDKRTRETYTGLLTFEDRSEVGDGWFHGHSLNDEQILSSASPAQVSVVHDGPDMVTFGVTITLSVPARYHWGEERPVAERVALCLTSRISLRRDAAVVDVETTVDNTAEDHRLRLLFPTDATAAKTYLAQHPFDLVERSIALDADTADWQEMELAEKPFLGLQAVGAGTRGLAFISAGGLHEGGVMDDVRRTLQVTLLRSFRKTVGTTGETDGLEKGRIVYRFALMPFAGTLPAADALRQWSRLQAGISTRQTGKRPSGYPAMTGTLPAEASYIELLSGKLIVSAIKPREKGGGLVLRLWNPTDRPQTESIRFWRDVKKAERLMLSEALDKKAPPPAVKGATVAVKAGPHQIVTIGVGF